MKFLNPENFMRLPQIFLLLITALIPNAWADMPLTIEDLITDKGKFKIDLSLSYANSDHQGLSLGLPIQIQTGPTSFIYLPTFVGERTGNSDTLVAVTNLRYGWSSQTEIYGRGSWVSTQQRVRDTTGIHNFANSGFSDAWLGINHQFKKDDSSPAILGFAETAIIQRYQGGNSKFKSNLLGVTTYTSLDPVVLSVTGAYRINQNRQDTKTRPGNLLLLNPSVAFAVNDRITLTTGFQWLNRAPDRINNSSSGYRQTSTDLVLGLGFGYDKENILNLTFKMNASGRNGADLRMNWLYKI